MLSLSLRGWEKDRLKPWCNRELLLQYHCQTKHNDLVSVLPTSMLYYPDTQCWLVDLVHTHCISIDLPRLSDSQWSSSSGSPPLNCYWLDIPYHILNNPDSEDDSLQVAVIVQSRYDRYSQWSFLGCSNNRRLHLYAPPFVKQVILLVLPQIGMEELLKRLTCSEKPVQDPLKNEPFRWTLEMKEKYRNHIVRRLPLVRVVFDDVTRIAIVPCNKCLAVAEIQEKMKRSAFDSLHRKVLVIPHSDNCDVQNWWCVQQQMTRFAIDATYCA